MTDPDVARRMSSAAEVEMELGDLQDAFERGEWIIPPPDAHGDSADGDEAPTAESATRETPTVEDATRETPTVEDATRETPPAAAPARRAGVGRRVAAVLVGCGLAGLAVWLWNGRTPPAPSAPPPAPARTGPASPVVVTQRIVEASSVDTNALAREAARQRERQERELAQIRDRLKASEEARLKAEREAAEAEAERNRLKQAQEQARRQAEAAERKRKAEADEAARQAEVAEAKRKAEEAKRKADEAARQAEAKRQMVEEAKRQEAERKRQAEAAEEARRRAERELQRTIANVQTSAVAIVRRYLDPAVKVSDVEGARADWMRRWKEAHPSADYAVEYARAANSIERARGLRLEPQPAAPARPKPATVRPKPAVRPAPPPAEVLQKLDDAAVCLDDGDELGALRLYAEVVAAGHALPDGSRERAESAFERYRLKNLDAQEIARTRTNSNYNEDKLKQELQQARKCLKAVQGAKTGRGEERRD